MKQFINPLSVVATLSGPGGSTLRLFDTLTGHLTLEKLLHDPASGHVSEPHHVGKHVTFDTDSTSIYALHNGHTVVKINGLTKDITWTWAAPDQTCVVFLLRFEHNIHTEIIAPLRYTHMSL